MHVEHIGQVEVLRCVQCASLLPKCSTAQSCTQATYNCYSSLQDLHSCAQKYRSRVLALTVDNQVKYLAHLGRLAQSSALV